MVAFQAGPRTSLAFISGIKAWNLEMSPALNANSRLRIKSCSVPLSASRIGCINCAAEPCFATVSLHARCNAGKDGTHKLAKVVDGLAEQRRDPEVVRPLDPLRLGQVLVRVDARQVPQRVPVVVCELGLGLQIDAARQKSAWSAFRDCFLNAKESPGGLQTHLVVIARDAVEARMDSQVDRVELVEDLFALVPRLLRRVVLARPQPEVRPLHGHEHERLARFGRVERRQDGVKEGDRGSRVCSRCAGATSAPTPSGHQLLQREETHPRRTARPKRQSKHA